MGRHSANFDALRGYTTDCGSGAAVVEPKQKCPKTGRF